MIIEPPPQYVHPTSGPVIERRLTAEEVENICGRGSQACSLKPLSADGTCFLWMPIVGRGGVGSRTFAALRRHEIAHCNGWKHP